MTGWLVLLLAVCLLPLAAGLFLLGARQPMRRLLPFYAAAVPFGSGLAVPGLPASYFSASSLLGLALTLALAYRLVVGGPMVSRLPAATAVWLLFVALCGSTVYWSLSPSDTLNGFVPLLATVSLYVLLRLTPVDAQLLRRFEWGIMAGGAAVAVYGLIQLGSGALGGGGEDRLGNALNDPNHLAASLLLPIALSLRTAVAPGRPPVRALVGLATVLMLVSVGLTASRGGLLGVLVVVVVLSTVGMHRARVAVVATLIAAVAAGTLVALPGGVHTRIYSSDSSGRTDVWRVAANACSQHCLIGSGWGTFSEVYARTLPATPEARIRPGRARFEPHNNLLLVGVETGAAGLLLVLTGLGLAVREALWARPGRRGVPLAALLGLLTTGMLVGNFEFKYFWLVLIYVGLTARAHPQGATEAGTARPPARRRTRTRAGAHI
jgi:O-antigen ligase